jgi:membrane-associated protein
MHIVQIILNFDQHLGSFIAQHGTLVYAMLFAIVFCEMGLIPLFFLPGDPLLFICGAFCATGAMDIRMLMPLLFVAAVAGSVVNYAIGAAMGRKVFTENHGWLDKNALRKTQAFYRDHGGVTFLVSPFIAVVRTFVPFVAGASQMPFARFMLFMVAGAAIWVVTLVTGGFFFGNIPLVHDHLSAIVLIGIGAGLGALVLARLWRLHVTPKTKS